MADNHIIKIANDMGVDEIFVGVRAFECIGANAPYDHPRIFLEMGDEDDIVCPYCSTRYRFNEKLGTTKSKPNGAICS